MMRIFLGKEDSQVFFIHSLQLCSYSLCASLRNERSVVTVTKVKVSWCSRNTVVLHSSFDTSIDGGPMTISPAVSLTFERDARLYALKIFPQCHPKLSNLPKGLRRIVV